jgi:hypothetical protein
LDPVSIALALAWADLGNVTERAGRPTAVERSREAELTETTGRLKDLKRDIQHNGYDVDSRVIADAILVKLRLVRQGRQALSGFEAGRSHPDAARFRDRAH